ncbi:methyl-accepting chemotaxis protein [Paenibacillus sp. DMB20]|uniref:methyl-accepting chemotaxis protein n=1 Tax=Paenibacillus sp. DMB20 TaxID=1642570 RepID=UPI0009E515C2|nr:methyl-accepting chemotaxis protein [Paenibacillus sp. DMB20]
MNYYNENKQLPYKSIGLRSAAMFTGAVAIINLLCFLIGLPVWAGFVISLALAVLSGYFISFWLLKRIADQSEKDLHQLASYIKRAVSGDLQEDEIQLSGDGVLKDMFQSFQQISVQYKELSDQVDKHIDHLLETGDTVKMSADMGYYVSDMIKESTLGVSAESEQQAEMIRISSRTLEDVTNAIQHIAESADEAATAANESSSKTADGQHAIRSAMERMDSISETVGSLVKKINNLRESSKEIRSFITIITEIAEQTHLLALNAAIEASRVGDEGKGFSVIAGEVRKLAEQSAESAKQVARVISVIQIETEETVASSEQVAREVAGGLKAVNDAGNSFEFIQLSIGEVAGQMQDVSSAVEEIAASSEQLTDGMRKTEDIADKTLKEMKNVTQAVEEHHSTMKQIMDASELLSNLSSELRSVMERFNDLRDDHPA